jgi:hypothetical protein
MRFVFACLIALGLTGSAALAIPVAAATSAHVMALDQQPPSAELNVDIDTDDGAWWANPVWIAIGVVALIVLMLIVAMAARGGGTTIIKE